MKRLKKAIILIIIFILAICLSTNFSMAKNYMADMWEKAENDLNGFFNMSVEPYTDGSTRVIESLTRTRSAYCIEPDYAHGGANRGNMKTYVIDVGKNGISSVNNYSTKDTGDSNNDYNAARAVMEIMYYATKAYQNNESNVFGADNTPYKMMLQGRLINNQANMGGLLGGVFSGQSYDLEGKMYAGQPARLQEEAQNYVNTTITYAFEDRSTKDIQAMYEDTYNDEEWMLVGPYKIENTGSGTISNITAISKAGSSYEAEGWSTTTSASDINQNKNLPNGTEFYIAFKNNKPDTIDKIVVKKTVTNAMRARMIFCESDGGQNIGIWGGTFDSSSSVDEIELPGVPFSYIKIVKQDEDSQKLLQNVGFIVYNETEGKWVKDGTPAEYVDSRDDATVYISNSRGEVNIRNLSKKGTYRIYEIIQPHFGYDEASIDLPSKEIVADIEAVGQTINLTIKNKRKYIKLSGFVWEDIISQKQSVRNYLYNQDENDDFDKLIANMTVSLRDANGNLLRAEDGHEIQPRKTNSEGQYMFGNYFASGYENEKILIESIINGAYIEFEYNGMTYKSVPLYNALDISGNENKGSRATDETNRNRTGENNPYFYSTRYATITSNEATDTQGRITNLEYDYANNRSTLKYSNNTSNYIYGYDGQTYPIDGIDNQYKTFANTKDANNGIMGKGLTANDIYMNNMEEIPYINLGIMEREMPDLSVMQDVQNAKVTLNGYEHIYQYSQRFDSDGEFRENGEDGFNVAVKFGEKYLNNSYTREIYSSDIIYNQSEEGNGKLGVYITYKIAIRNEATNIYTRLNELANYYDDDFELIATGYEIDENGNVVNSIQNRVDEGYNQNGYKKSIIYAGTGENIPPIGANESNTIEIYVQYKLNNDAINSVLNQDLTLASITEVTSYSSFENGFNTVYSGVDRDSRPDSITPNDRTTYEDDTDSAPTLVLKATNTRIIQGTIWEDNAIEELLNSTGYDKRREGDGRYEAENENVIRNVQVELLTIGDGGTYITADLYQRGQDDAVPAQYTTGNDGRYIFEGVIPGQYLLKYTYGNNSYIVDIDNGTETQIEAQKYKSTKFRDGNKEEAEDDNLYWYRAETDGATRLSDARDISGKYSEDSNIENRDNVDIVERRTTVDIVNYDYAVEDAKLEEITAESKEFDIKLDYDINLDNISEYGANLKFDFNNIDFGIIRRPKQEMRIKKEISYIEVVLANGQILIQGDPRTDSIPNLRLIPQSSNPQEGQTVYIEIDNEIIQGATLRVEYEITVDLSACEVDYNDKDYYYYNRVPANYTQPGVWRMATVTDLYDYVSNDLNYDESNNPDYGWVSITADQIEDGYLSPEALEIFKTYNKVLHTDYFKDMSPDADNRIKTAKLYLTRLLSNNEMDFTFDNDVEVNEVTGRVPDESIPGNYIPSEGPNNPDNPAGEPSEPDESTVEIIITGPTGGNQNYIIYGIIGLAVIVIFSTGIILIKKFLKK